MLSSSPTWKLSEWSRAAKLEYKSVFLMVGLVILVIVLGRCWGCNN